MHAQPGMAGPGGWILGPGGHDREGGEIDIVIPVRVGERNEHLRYALRSLAGHLPHDRIWIVGHRPQWLRNVHHIPTTQSGSKYANTTTAMRAACHHVEVSDPFIWANDDIFVMHALRVLPTVHRGRVADVDTYYRRKGIQSAYLKGMRATWQLLRRLGHPDPLSYEVHAPMLVIKDGMLEALTLGAGVPAVHKRTLYGNLQQIGGRRIRDPKVLGRGAQFPRNSLYLSTMPTSFEHGKVGEFVREKFPTECRYEVPGSQPRPPRPGVYGSGRAPRQQARRRRTRGSVR